MLLWVGFIGKLVELMLTKIIGKRIDLRLDQRKQAAKAFLDLHDALVALGDAADEFVRVVGPVVAGTQPRLYRGAVDAIASRADTASGSLLRSLDNLHSIIEIYDPTLGDLLRGVASVKRGLALTRAGSRMKFELLPNPESVFSIVYSAPTEQLMATSLEEGYRAAHEVRTRIDRGGTLMRDWPEDLLLSFVSADLVEGRLRDDDVAHIRRLHEMVSKYSPFLAKAREQLDALIRQSFSIEDLLYVRSGSRLL